MHLYLSIVNAVNMILYYAEYLEVVTQSLDTTGQECNKQIEAATLKIGEWMKDAEGRSKLKDFFKYVCISYNIYLNTKVCIYLV